MNLLNIVYTAVLGVIQGITEWLPISSTAHLILAQKLLPLDMTPEFFDVFSVVIQFGSILAVLCLYFRRLNPFSSAKPPEERAETWTLWKNIAVGCIPIVALGLPLDALRPDVLSGTIVIAAALIVYGIAFLVIEKQQLPVSTQLLSSMSTKTAFLIGCFQVLAVVPGTSRSGATIFGALLLGCSRTVASEFSFFLAVPVMAGASLLKLVKYLVPYGMFTGQECFLLAVGTLVAFKVSLLAIRFLLGYIRSHDFQPFGIYRIALGVIILAYFGL